MESLDARSEFVEAIESRSLHGTEWYCLPRFRQPELKVGISRILRRVCQEYGYDGRQFADGPTVDRGPLEGCTPFFGRGCVGCRCLSWGEQLIQLPFDPARLVSGSSRLTHRIPSLPHSLSTKSIFRPE